MRHLFLGFCLCSAAGAQEDTCGLRLNQIQVVGTHNSYHSLPDEERHRLLRGFLPEARTWVYEHASLDVQLDRNVRSFELDLYRSPDGFRVFHVPFYDENATCPTFQDCLALVRAWSEAHPGHLPISFLLELKEEEQSRAKEATLSFDAEALDILDAAIRSVFGADALLTPDGLRGDAPTLSEAVQDRGWPRLENVRGKVFFILHEGKELRDLYVQNRPSLEGRAMFVRSAPGRADAAVLVVDNPFEPAIPDLVRQGFLVRTRADAGLKQGKSGDTRRREAAFSSGAQIISTDFPPGEAHPETGYTVAIPEGGPARCNPVNAPTCCSLSARKTNIPE